MTNQQIADAILTQLGGSKFRAMTGAKNFAYGDRYLQFQISRAANKAKYVRVALELNDTYTVTFSTMNRAYEVRVISTHEMIYGDTLQALFTQETGLDTHL